MVLLVFVHGYNMEVRYLQPWTMPAEKMDISGFIEYLFANGLLRFRIPMLFIISGFLFAMHDDKPYRTRVQKRFRTLFLPYLVWSFLGLAFTYLLEMIPAGRSMVAGSHVVQIDDTRMLIHDYHWYEVLVKWIFLPVPYQLWFIRVLFIYNLAYPGIRWCIEHKIVKWIFFSFAFLMWLGTFNVGLLEGEGLLFFSLGIWIQKSNFNIEKSGRWLNPSGWGILFLLFATVKTLLAFSGSSFVGNATTPMMIILHKLTVASGLIACWYGFDPLVKWCMDRKWFTWLSAFSFIIYAIHAPLVAYLIDPFLVRMHSMPGAHLLTFFLLPVSVIALAVFTGWLLRGLIPGGYKFLTGGRGL